MFFHMLLKLLKCFPSALAQAIFKSDINTILHFQAEAYKGCCEEMRLQQVLVAARAQRAGKSSARFGPPRLSSCTHLQALVCSLHFLCQGVMGTCLGAFRASQSKIALIIPGEALSQGVRRTCWLPGCTQGQPGHPWRSPNVPLVSHIGEWDEGNAPFWGAAAATGAPVPPLFCNTMMSRSMPGALKSPSTPLFLGSNE